jgi:succinylarginine dihydrolase
VRAAANDKEKAAQRVEAVEQRLASAEKRAVHAEALVAAAAKRALDNAAAAAAAVTAAAESTSTSSAAGGADDGRAYLPPSAYALVYLRSFIPGYSINSHVYINQSPGYSPIVYQTRVRQSLHDGGGIADLTLHQVLADKETELETLRAGAACKDKEIEALATRVRQLEGASGGGARNNGGRSKVKAGRKGRS